MINQLENLIVTQKEQLKKTSELFNLYELLLEKGFSEKESAQLLKLHIDCMEEYDRLSNLRDNVLPRILPIGYVLSGDMSQEDILSDAGKDMLYQLGFENYTLRVGNIVFNNKPYTGLYIYGIEREDREWMQSGNATERDSVVGTGGVSIYEQMVEKVINQDFEELSLDEIDNLFSDRQSTP